MDIDIRELLILSTIQGIGSYRLKSLVSYFNGTSPVFDASAENLVCVEGIEQKTASCILRTIKGALFPEASAFAQDQLSRLNRRGGRILTVWDKDYPPNLKRIYDPPAFLFVHGGFLPEDSTAIAIVGTRNPSSYGALLAARFAGELSSAGFCVISGLARGVDTIAHTDALRTGGRTCCVIGSGLDVIYPGENRELARRIAAHGAVITEFPMGTQPDAVNFPRRNRVISGLSLGTLVIETGVDGGAMITASFALEQNREVFAVPGPLSNERLKGNHLLIKEGRAKLTESIADILAEIEPSVLRSLDKASSSQPAIPPPSLTLFEEKVLQTVGTDPVHVDEIAARSLLPVSQALVELLGLELKGLIDQLPGKCFRRK